MTVDTSYDTDGVSDIFTELDLPVSGSQNLGALNLKDISLRFPLLQDKMVKEYFYAHVELRNVIENMHHELSKIPGTY